MPPHSPFGKGGVRGFRGGGAIRCIGGVAAGEDIGFLFVVDMASTNIDMLLEGNWRVTASVIAQVIAIAKDGIAIRLFARSRFIFSIISAISRNRFQSPMEFSFDVSFKYRKG